jgi:transcriptional regulator with XRE-family HTH domain
MSLGARMAQLRLRQDESLQDVADAVGVSKAHIWELEKGRAANPSMTLLQGVADHFGVKISFLIGEDVDSPDADQRLARMFRQARELSEDDLDLIDSMITTMLERQLRDPAGRRASARARTLHTAERGRKRRLRLAEEQTGEAPVVEDAKKRSAVRQTMFEKLVRRRKRSSKPTGVADRPPNTTETPPEPCT